MAAAVRFATLAGAPSLGTTAPAGPTSPMTSDVAKANAGRAAVAMAKARREKWLVPMICSFRERLESRGANTYASVGLYAYTRVGANPCPQRFWPLDDPQLGGAR